MELEALNTYPLSSYIFDNLKSDKHFALLPRLARLRHNYENEGMITRVEAILLVHEHNHPHILLLRYRSCNFYKLPGGRIESGENGMKRKLSSRLGPIVPYMQPDWQIRECVAKWWRPDFEYFMYPYCPPHITNPKECTKLFLVQLSESECFHVARNLNLVAVPLFELYDNAKKYGAVISSIPQLLSRYRLNMINP